MKNTIISKAALSAVLILGAALCGMAQCRTHSEVKTDSLANGVFRLTVGTPDEQTPYAFCPEEPRYKALAALTPGQLPFGLQDIDMRVTSRGSRICIPLQDGEEIYGFGLQIGSFRQRGLKKKPIVNDHPQNNLGYTHGPETFYVSTKGYGILVNTFRYTTFHCGSNTEKAESQNVATATGDVKTTTEELYANRKAGNYVYVDVPNCDGVEVFVFKADDLKGAVQKYNLFAGGGCLPPMWGLGLKYRSKTQHTEADLLRFQNYFREKEIPCDVLGFEPGWHTAAYSCSYVWNKERFPDHEALLKSLKENHYRANLWEHAYVHPTSPIFEQMKPYSGDFLVWDGLVPDFTLPEARKIFTDYHKTLVHEGVSAFKLDECDNSDISAGNQTWGFPEMSSFPSGMDGEQMHQALGKLYVQTLSEMFESENMRTYMDYRASGLFATSIPASLYSDHYGYHDYIDMVCNSAFGGLLWSPELREAGSKNEFFARFQLMLLSAHAVVNCWFLDNPAWLQYNTEKNNAGIFLPDSLEMEDVARKLINERMRLIPYLYNAFAHYYMDGVPPFRPLVMDYTSDSKTWDISKQYMIGDNLMAAPLLDESGKRMVYFPEGTWYNYNTNEKYEGGQEIEVAVNVDQMPLFVKGGTILPLAKPLQYIADDSVFDVTCYVYGDTESAAPVTLFEDDGITYDYKHKSCYNWVTLSLKKGKGRITREGTYPGSRYNVNKNFVFIR